MYFSQKKNRPFHHENFTVIFSSFGVHSDDRKKGEKMKNMRKNEKNEKN